MRPYRDSITAGLAAGLVAGLVVSAVDLALAAERAGGLRGHALELAWLLVGLYALPCVLAGVGAGIIGGAWRATFGEGSLGAAYTRLQSDQELDRRVCGALFATLLVAVIFVLVAAALATRLVGAVERKSVGAVLFGGVLAASLPAFVLLGFPVYRATRRLASLVPRGKRVPATLLVVTAGALTAVALVAAVVVTRLDWRALDFGPIVTAALFVAVAVGWTILARTALSGLRSRVPAREWIALAAAAVAVLVGVLVLRSTPSADALVLLTEHTSGGRKLLAFARASSDGDGDGYSALLGGPDCDDRNPEVHPDAKEIPGNGIDDNCLGGDRVAAARAPEDDAPDDAPTPDLGFRGNLLVLVIDTMRADRLGSTGYRRNGRSLTPNLDRLAAGACHFSRTYAQATNTARSMPSLFNSLYPSQVAVDRHFRNFSQTLDENLSMFEVLQAAGVRTVGYSSHYFFDVNKGARQGFDEYDNAGAKRMEQSSQEVTAPRIVPKALARLEALAESGQRFAMFIHLFEPHSAYVEHAEFPVPAGGGLRARYDYEIAYDDLWTGRILDALENSGVADNTMVVVLSDHGEGFGEHRVAGQRMYYHGRTLYEEMLRVLLLVRIPGVEPRRIDAPVMLLDVAPTLVQAMGIDVPAAFQGRSLLPEMRGDARAARPAFAELLPAPYWNHSAKAMISADGRHKIIYRISDRRFELYDLARDPGETRSLYRAEPALAEAMTQKLLDWIEVDL